MAEMALQPLTPAALGELTRLCATALEHEEAFTAPFLARQIFAPEADPDLCLAVSAHGRLAGFAAGRILEAGGARHGFIRILAVREDERRKGVATLLLDELERRLGSAGAVSLQTGGDAPGWLFPGVDVRYTAALCLFEARGYRVVAEPANMEIDLRRLDLTGDALKRRLAGEGFTIRRLDCVDRAPFDRYLSARWSAVWRAEALAALEQTPPAGYAALRGEEICGFAVYDIARPGWFGPTGVDDEQRGRGLGAALLTACLRDWQRQGRERCEIAWVGPVPFYSRAAGARICRVYRQYRKA